jgi:hypothetical protein
LETTEIAATAWKLLEQWNKKIYQSMAAAVHGNFWQLSGIVKATWVSLAFE